jgi:hypothetical protein
MVAVLYWVLTAAVAALMMQLERRFAAPVTGPLRLLDAAPALALER